VTGDPGLQPERAALAWSRTALVFLGVGALVVLAATDLTSRGKAVGILVAVAILTVIFAALRRQRVSQPALGRRRHLRSLWSKGRQR
jgi:uncharacterized membrane protein YidH (DUF202 family)